MNTITTTHSKDNLIAGSFPLVTESIVLEEGQNLVRGTVIGKRADGKFAIARDSIAEPATPAVVPFAVLAKDTNATTTDTKTVAYLTGQFSEDALVFSEDLTMTGVKDALRALGIFVTATIDNSPV